MENIIEKIKNLIEKQIDNLEDKPIRTTITIVIICWIFIVIFKKLREDK